ncbi:hypothetical protein BV455_03825 [Parageobacillus caldoxylosilyticus]|nr:hypothetical protein BV455_03825 [Parageobacillus caldoxylosilyticus]
MEDLAIRTANQEDIPQLLNLMYQYIVDFYKRPKPTEKSLKGLIQLLLNNPASGIQFVAEQDGKLLGFATLYFSFSTLHLKRMAILNDLFVIPKHEGKN